MTLEQYKVALGAVCQFAGGGDIGWDDRFLEGLKLNGLELKTFDHKDELGRNYQAPHSFNNPLTWPHNTVIGVI